MIVRSETVSNIKGVFSKPFELSLIVPIDELLKRSGESVPFEVLIIVSPEKFQDTHFKRLRQQKHIFPIKLPVCVEFMLRSSLRQLGVIILE